MLHPAFLGPLGVFALTWSVLRSTGAAVGWTVVFVVAAVPVAATWWVGLRRGWWSDRDLSVRRERPGVLVIGLASSALLLIAVQRMAAPAIVRELALAGLVATALFTLATVVGTKVSGHVAVPVAIVVLLSTTSYRGPWPFLLAALAVSWARVHERRHTPREVLAGWGIAGAASLVALIAGRLGSA